MARGVLAVAAEVPDSQGLQETLVSLLQEEVEEMEQHLILQPLQLLTLEVVAEDVT